MAATQTSTLDFASNSRPAPSWIGRALSLVLVLALLVDGGVQLFAPQLLAADMAASGFPQSMSSVLGLITLTCVVLYAIPRTAVLGAVLITGFLGGAIAMHFRLGEVGTPPQLICLILGALAWGGLYLRDPRLRALLPLTA